jgi:uncharacterized repeat protein (TIGR01451 family)
MNNSTLSNNSADNIGGIDNHAGTLILTHSTMAENSANTIGGIYSHNSFVSAHFTLNSSIIANPTSSGDCINVDGSVTSSYSLIADSNNTCGLIDGIDNNLIGHDPLLLPLADNGGNTWTHALLPTSPAVDHVSVSSNGCGTIIVTDQRGVTRPQDGDGDGTLSCDIGAFEIESLAIYKTGPAAVATGQPITYFLNISNNSDIALTGVIITDAIPAGATYLGGGTQVGSIVSWTVPNLIAGETITRQFAVLATSTITNSDYRVTVSEGYNAIGYVPVVTVIQEPVSGLAAINDSPTIIGSNTTLTATITQGEDVTYTWNFGDGQGASGAVVEHNYPAIGVYTAVVTASNSVSTATATVTVTISSEFTFTIYLPIIRKPEM